MFIVDIDGVLLLNPVVVDGDRWNLRCTLADVNYGSPRLLLILFNLIMKVVASDEVEVILITIIFAIVNLTMSYRGLITLKLTIEVSLSLSLTAELCESRFFPLMLRAGKRIIRKKDYRYRFSCLSSSLWHVLMKNDSFRSS